ncbi:MAG TPA: LacI family DNA-binding transcriptional regulator [Tepidisphaeraceae bacterium]
MPPTPTLIDIARETNTSVSTVSRVLAGGTVAERISEETRGRVMKVAKQMGYRPNLLARSLRTRKTYTVAMIVADISNPFFSQIASYVEQQLHREGYSLVLCNSCEDPELEDEYLQLLPRKGIDGLILVPLMRGKKALTEMLPKNLPLVILDRPIPGIPASVSSDQDQMTHSLCDTLERDGVKKVLLIGGPANIYTHRRRAEIIAERFEVVARHDGPAAPETGRQAFVQNLGSDFDAVVATNNFLAMGFIDSIETIDEPPVIGTFDDIPLMHLLPLPIVVSMQDIPMLADGCVRQLLPQLNGQTRKIEPILLGTRVVTNRAFQSRHNKGR